MLPLIGAHRVPRRLPEAGARPHRAQRSTGSIAHVEDQLRLRRADRQREPGSRGTADGAARPRPGRATVHRTPSIEWYALAPDARSLRRRRRSCSWSSARSCPNAVPAARYAVGHRRHRRRRRARRRALAVAATCRTTGPTSLIAGAIGLDGFSRVPHRASSRSRVILAALFADGYLAPRAARRAASSTCSCCCRRPAASMMASANDLIVLFLGLEILSIALYVLAGHATCAGSSRRRRPSSTSCSARSRRRSSSTASPSSTARPARRTSRRSRSFLDQQRAARERAAARRPRAAARRPRLQGRGGAVPHVDARRVPGRADAVTAFMASAAKAAAFAALLRVFVVAFAAYRVRLAAGRSGCSPCSRCSSAPCSPSCRPT